KGFLVALESIRNNQSSRIRRHRHNRDLEQFLLLVNSARRERLRITVIVCIEAVFVLLRDEPDRDAVEHSLSNKLKHNFRQVVTADGLRELDQDSQIAVRIEAKLNRFTDGQRPRVVREENNWIGR